MCQESLPFENTHPFFASRHQYGLASQPLANRFASLLNRLIVITMQARGLRRFKMIRRDERHPFVEAKMLDFRIDDNGNFSQSRQAVTNSDINPAVTTPLA